jgi:splicing factor 3B subunit 1
MTGLAISALAEAANPYGIDAFEPIIAPLWNGIRHVKGRTLQAFLKAIG